MPEPRSLPLWHGRTLALLAILLVALNLRTAVAALSPVYGLISADVPLGTLSIGVLGMLPPICFAVFGLGTPLLTRRLSLEASAVLAVVAMGLGSLVRGVSVAYPMLVIGSIVAFAGMGVGNVLLPPLVKRYFPDRIGLATTLYVVLISVSTLLPPLIAVPVAHAAGWRVSVGMWALLAIVALVPFAGMRRAARNGAAAGVETVRGAAVERLGRSSVAWSVLIVFTVSSINAYAFFAWLPEMLTDTVGASAAQAGALLSLYGGVGILSALFVPVLAARMKNVGLLVYVGVAFFFVGDLGLIVLPATATWLWVALAGLGPMLFPLGLALINLRTRTHEGAVALSGFVQGFGYVIAAAGPLVFGFLHDVTGGWNFSVVFLLGTAVLAAVAGTVVARPHMLEDDLHRRRSEPRG